MKSLLFFATAAKGIETLLAEELSVLGLKDVKVTRAGVFFKGELQDAYRACLWSRLANRILLPVARFMAPSSDELYRQVKGIKWTEHMDVTQTLAVDASVSNSFINHSRYAALKTKDAIADYFRDVAGERPFVRVEQPDIQINVYINHDEAQLYIDLSGTSLHLRGYRTRGSVAPLKENLAAAILYRAGWPEIHLKGGAFVDFMCGSGTLPIEAALIACDIAPGLTRDYFGLLGWKQHDPEIWQQLIDEARSRRTEGLKRAPRILGFDHHHASLEKARQHVQQAGLADIVEIQHQDLFSFDVEIHDSRSSSSKGLVVLNPPYGKRLGQDEDLIPLYSGIGQVLKTHFMGWKASVFTDDQSRGKAIGIRANRIHSLFNGAMPCKLLHFEINDSEIFQSHRLPRLVNDEDLSEQSTGFRNRLTKNLKQRGRWSRKENITCFRLYDADLPDYAVAIDLYEGEQLWVNIQEYEAPPTVDAIKAKLRLREVVTIVRQVLQVDEANIFLKNRHRQRGDAQYEKLDDTKNFHVVREGACEFWVNFEDYLDTGLFLDHRPLRLKIAATSEGRSLLNLFAYTGAVSVHAAKAGARRTLTVDMSKTYIDWARRNMELNAITDDSHRFLQVDCLAWLAQPTVKKLFDIIFLDPPSFSNSKRMRRPFDVQKDHSLIVNQAMKLLEHQGVLYFSTNLRRFKLDHEALKDFSILDITDRSIPVDFKQRKHIHRCWELRHPAPDTLAS